MGVCCAGDVRVVRVDRRRGRVSLGTCSNALVTVPTLPVVPPYDGTPPTFMLPPPQRAACRGRPAGAWTGGRQRDYRVGCRSAIARFARSAAAVKNVFRRRVDFRRRRSGWLFLARVGTDALSNVAVARDLRLPLKRPVSRSRCWTPQESSMAKKEITSKPAARSASKTLSSSSTGKASKSAAGSALSQRKALEMTTSSAAAKAASKTLRDGRTAEDSKSAAGSALTQKSTPKER